MATSFEVIFLGSLQQIDTTQGNETVENAAGILGTYGSTNAPLSSQVQNLTANYLFEDADDSYDLDNGGGYDSFRINGGVSQNFDAVADYFATITYVDGTTATITATVFQDVNGNTYLAPEETLNADQFALTAKPIQSLSLNSVASNTGDMMANRVAGDFISAVDGTTGADNMGVGYTDAQGDQITNGNDFVLAGSGNDTVSAGWGNDTVRGDAGNDQIYGGAGADSIYGGSGADTVYGGTETDLFYGGTEGDVLYGEAGSDTISGESGNDFIDGGTEGDALVGGQGKDTIFGGDGADTIIGDGQWYRVSDYPSSTGGSGTNLAIVNSADGPIDLWRINASGTLDYVSTVQPGQTVVQATTTTDNYVLRDADGYYQELIRGASNQSVTYGSSGLDDSLDGGLGNDSIVGQFGNDTIDSGAGSDTIYGGTGNDIINAGTENDLIYGGAGNDNILAGDGTDTVYGGAGDDTIDDWSGNDLVYAGDGNDLANVSSGNDTFYMDAGNDLVNLWDNAGQKVLYGGTGNDTLDFTNWQSSVGVNLTIAADGSGTFSHFSGNTTGSFHDFEVLSGTAFNDTINGSANTTGLSYYGEGGADYITVGSGSDWIDGGDGNDTLNFGTGDNTVFGGVGDDVIDDTPATYLTSNSLLYGGSGNDSIWFGEGNSTIYGGSGNDYIDDHSGELAGANLLYGGDGADTVFAGLGNDSLYGDAGNDQLYGETGDDLIYGGNDSDSLYGGIGNDTLDGGQGADSLDGGGGNDSMSGGLDNDTLSGGAGADTLFGGTGADSLSGGEDADFIYGGAGDTIVGGEGGVDNDTLVLNYADVQSVTYGGGNNEAGTITFTAASGGGTLTFSEIENLRFAGAVEGTTGADNIVAGYIDADGDAIDGTDGDPDVVLAGAGNDTVNGMAGNDTIYGGDGADIAFGGGGADLVYGGDGADTIVGMTGNDTLFGDAGDDVVAGMWDDDSLEGGAGNDTAAFVGDVTEYRFDYDPSGATIVTDLVSGRDGTDTISGFEYVEFNGVTYHLVTGDDGSNTTLQGPNDGTPSLIIAHDGNDWGGGHPTSDVIFGGAGDDTLDGGDGNDTLLGEEGNDLLRGGAGNDQIFGGAGSDTIQGGLGDDSLSGGDDADRFVVQDGFGNDTVTGGEGGNDADTLDLSALSNGATVVLTGDEAGTVTTFGTDTLSFSEIERVEGSANNDYVNTSAATTSSPVISAGGGDDILEGGSANDTFFGGDGNDTLSGQSGDDNLSGDAGADLISGGDGADQIFGGSDNDTLYGGAGNDSLTGGAGEDTIGLTQYGGADTVVDFDMTLSGGRTADQLDVSDLRTLTGDPITWRDVVVTDTVGDGSGDAVLTFPGGESVILQGVSPDQVDSKQEMISVGIPCFAEGSKIQTPAGWKPVERLRVGDVVETLDGPRPLIWVGQSRLDAEDLARNPDHRPIHFPAGAIGNSRALRLSPQHAVLMRSASNDLVFVRAKHLALIGFRKARVAQGVRQVCYHHILLQSHAVVCAEGAPTESFYPGTQVTAMMDLPTRLAISAAIHGRPMAMLSPKRWDLTAVYGPRAHPLAGRRALDALSAVSFDRAAVYKDRAWGKRSGRVASAR